MKKLYLYSVIIIIVILLIVIGVSFYIKLVTKKHIYKNDEKVYFENVDCIIILGAGIRGGKPSKMLEDRLLTGIKLYKDGVAPKIIMSGDHSQNDYDEVNVMKKYAIEKGVLSEDIFMDHAGFSTYESIYRAKEIFQTKKVVIVTQEFHLYRAIYIANKFDLVAYGVSSDLQEYSDNKYLEIREIFARNKDFVKCIYKPKPTYLGQIIPVSGNGDATNDENV